MTAGAADTLPPFQSLRVQLGVPDDPIAWRIEGIQPAGTRAMLAAQSKAGKTSAVVNIVQALADNGSVFGTFATTPIAGVVTVLDFEMSQRQLKAWYRAQGIRRDDHVELIAMRGRVGDFNILNPLVRRRWAARLRSGGTQYLVLDCLRPLLDALGLDEHREAGRLLVAIDALMADAGIPDLLLVHHMGHANERSRGDSRLRDWPDVEWALVRKTDDAGSPRFFRAYGRDVDVPEGQLMWDGSRRRLSLVGGSRKDARLDAIVTDIADVLSRAGKALSGREIKEALEDSSHARNDIDAALLLCRTDGRLRVEEGPRKAFLYSAVSQCPQCPVSVTRTVSQCPVPLKERDTGHWILRPSVSRKRSRRRSDHHRRRR